ncbi:High-affinity choline uptake protein BetT [Klebsiella pneumoniae]|nr:High-affinity choline uptake protein BetT [Klebsiella pneumoniae]
MTDLSQSREKDKINPVVFYTSAGLILLFSLMTIFFRDFSAEWIGRTLDWVSKTFGWYYLLAATLYIVFVVCIACSRFGSVKLGPEQSKPEFSLLSWAAMLFAAGIGIDLMFFSVAEPVTQYMQPPEGAGQTIEAARQAMVWTLFHYGLTGWSMYALMGMALGYFSYRYNLPLTIRSALYPIFGKRINGPIGHSVDIAAVIGTIFGIATTLGIGVVQLNYGLSVLFDIPDSLAAKAALIALSVIIATISVTSGVDKGIRVLSELNVALALGLILFVLFMGRYLLPAQCVSAQRRRLRQSLYGHDAEQLRLRPAGSMDEQLDALFLGVVGGLVAVCGPVPGAHFARAHHPPVCDGHPDYSLHLYPAVAVGVRQQRAV